MNKDVLRRMDIDRLLIAKRKAAFAGRIFRDSSRGDMLSILEMSVEVIGLYGEN